MRSRLRYDVLALDLDGTLTTSDKRLTDRTKEALGAAAEAGARIVLASGRPVVGMTHVADELGLAGMGGYVLSSNGSRIVDWGTGEAVRDVTVPREAIDAACRVSREYGVDALLYDERRMYSEHPEARYVEKERFNNSATAVRVDDLATYVDWLPNKVMVVGEPEPLTLALDALSRRLEGLCSVFLSEPYFIEITPLGVRKDAALSFLLGRLGADPSRLMACGDGLNDIPMLEIAGFAVAMGNAYDQVKEIADWIAPSNDDDGVAVAVERFVLKEGRCS